jgi:hypothetical protein
MPVGQNGDGGVTVISLKIITRHLSMELALITEFEHVPIQWKFVEALIVKGLTMKLTFVKVNNLHYYAVLLHIFTTANNKNIGKFTSIRV